LRAANEEVLSSNEELQSTNEELETAKEELQSSNEELTTLNEELQNRNTELSQTANDLYGLLNGVEMPVAILGKDLCIRRFSSAAERLFNLINSDIGRPISQIRPNLEGPDLTALANKVVATMTPLETEIRDQKGNWYALRIRPYHSEGDRIEGVLIALVDVNDLKQFSSALVDTIAESILVLDPKFNVISANAAFLKTFQVKREDVENHILFEVSEYKWNIRELRELLGKTLPEKKFVVAFELEGDFPRAGHKVLSLNARLFEHREKERQRTILVINDITPGESEKGSGNKRGR